GRVVCSSDLAGLRGLWGADGLRPAGAVHGAEPELAEVREAREKLLALLRRQVEDGRPPIVLEAGSEAVLLERNLPGHAAPCLSFPAVFCTVFSSKRINMRKSGVAFDREEHAPGVCAAGVVLRDLVGNDLAISMPVPAQRLHARAKLIVGRLDGGSLGGTA